MKLWHCVVLTVAAFLFIISEMFGLWLPLVALIQNLSASENVAQVSVPRMWHMLINPAFGWMVLLMALASVIGSIAGLRRETGGKAGWIVTLVFGVIVLLFAAVLTYSLPRFAVFFKDLGIK